MHTNIISALIGTITNLNKHKAYFFNAVQDKDNIISIAVCGVA